MQRQCPRCGLMNALQRATCSSCLTPLRQKRFHMDRNKITYIHVLKNRKGLTDEFYRLRLNALGVNSCKELKAATYYKFINGLKALPDAA